MKKTLGEIADVLAYGVTLVGAFTIVKSVFIDWLGLKSQFILVTATFLIGCGSIYRFIRPDKDK